MPKRIIIDDEDDDGAAVVEKPPSRWHARKLLKRLKEENRDASGHPLVDNIPLEAPVRDTASPSSTTSNVDLTTTIIVTPQKKSRSPSSKTGEMFDNSRNSTSPFKTPTGKSRQSPSTIESLGLSPQDSVFWVRTPPSEALKRLERMNSGRSHEEELASIVGRLYETSSAGTALQTMGQGSKDRIKDMLNTIRGSNSSSYSSLDDELLETADRPDPVSPTKGLVDRHKAASALRRGLSRHQSADGLGGVGKRRERAARGISLFGSSHPAELTSSAKSREDVLKMIDHINANMTTSTQQDQTNLSVDSSSKHTLSNVSETLVASAASAATSSTYPLRPEPSDGVPRTPLRNSHPKIQSSPGEFDDEFFTEFEMNDQDIEELTQLELSSTSLNSECSRTTLVPSASSNHDSLLPQKSWYGEKSLNLDTRPKNLDACSSSNTEAEPETFFDDFDDFDDIQDLEDDFGIDDDDEDDSTINVLTAVEESEGATSFRIYLCDSWATTRVTSGDIVHIISALIYTSDTPELVLSDAQGYLIVKPDTLVSTSVLAESFACIRKPIIDIRARKSDESSVPIIHGTMLHELFQQSLKTNDFSVVAMESAIDRILKTHLNDLCLVNESADVARESMAQRIPACQDWARRYLRPTPTEEGVIDGASGHMTNGTGGLLCVNKVLDIEENIWSPMFGLKGKIDASLQVMFKTSDTKTLTVPFELKTGRKSNVISHRAQTMLYTLLMTDRYDVDVQWGLLFYLKTGEFFRVQAPHDEIRTILMQRNEIAVFDNDKTSLPPMAQSTQKCGNCFSFSSCTVLHKLLEDGTAESSGLGRVFDDATDHLNDVHAQFLQKWTQLLSLEQGDVAKFQSQIWSMGSADRQAVGNCFSSMLLVEDLTPDQRGPSPEALDDRFARHRYRFRTGSIVTPLSQQTLSQTLRGGQSLLSSNISVGDPIVVSSESRHYALAIGHVIDMSLSEITVGLDRPLLGPPMRLDDFDPKQNQSYRGLIEIASSAAPSTGSARSYHSHLQQRNTTFRIDKDEMAAGFARTRNNLIQLFRADKDGGDAKRRHLVVDLERPTFEPIQGFKHQDQNLNDDQRRAVEAVLSARDYALILGMPGTGKTTTIAHIIHTLVAHGKSVLLSSYTHSAVDNVLLKLHADLNIVRLGNKDKVHRDIQALVPDFTKPPMNTVEAIHNFYAKCQVVGTTCLGIGDPLFTEKRFDYCIVDEASQITLPACLGPIRYADVFVLVGDHHQLPPLVKNTTARKGGFDLSLFKMLSDRYPESVTSLTQQYRMNKDVMLLSNTLVYENRLQCATEEVANKILHIPAMDAFRRRCHPRSVQNPPTSASGAPTSYPTHCVGHSHDHPCWLERTLDPQCSVVFVDTEDVPAREVQVGSSTQNPTEAMLVHQLVEALVSGGITEQHIGIISVLRSQLKVLSRLLRGRPLLDIHTVDRYQGKDKECVIVSLVRSNSEQYVGELLKDWRRINVAFTRAKKKLIVVGSRRTLQGSPVFERFLQLMERQRWILKLPPNAHHQHPCLSAGGSSGVSPIKAGGRGAEEEDKENRWQDANSAVAGARKESKVVLKRNAVAKNIIDSL
ncbi:Tripartite DNA replication factor [Dissophora globulifera]|nr:Tripartite DNA replication factor [Dissophora globulifera]